MDLKASVADVTGLAIEGGSTLLVNAIDALPAFSDTALSIENGNLTLNKNLKTAITTITVKSGILTVPDGGYIGNGSDSTPDSTVELKAEGQLVLGKELTLRELETAEGSAIDTNGKTLSVAKLQDDKLNAAVTGNLQLVPAADLTATLKKKVEGEITVNAKNDAKVTLDAQDDVDRIEFQAVMGANPASATLKLAAGKRIKTLVFGKGNPFRAELAGNNEVDSLFLHSTNPLTVKSPPENSGFTASILSIYLCVQ